MIPDGGLPIPERLRVKPEDLVETPSDRNDVQKDKDDNDANGDPNGLIEAAQENKPQQSYQNQRDNDFVVEDRQAVCDEWVFDYMCRGVGRRKSDGDDETCRNEPEQDQDEHLALPARQEAFQHRNGTVSVWAFLRDPTVHR